MIGTARRSASVTVTVTVTMAVGGPRVQASIAALARAVSNSGFQLALLGKSSKVTDPPASDLLGKGKRKAQDGHGDLGAIMRRRKSLKMAAAARKTLTRHGARMAKVSQAALMLCGVEQKGRRAANVQQEATLGGSVFGGDK